MDEEKRDGRESGRERTSGRVACCANSTSAISTRETHVTRPAKKPRLRITAGVKSIDKSPGHVTVLGGRLTDDGTSGRARSVRRGQLDLPPAEGHVGEEAAEHGRHRLAAGDEHHVERDEEAALLRSGRFGEVQGHHHARQAFPCKHPTST